MAATSLDDQTSALVRQIAIREVARVKKRIIWIGSVVVVIWTGLTWFFGSEYIKEKAVEVAETVESEEWKIAISERVATLLRDSIASDVADKLSPIQIIPYKNHTYYYKAMSGWDQPQHFTLKEINENIQNSDPNFVPIPTSARGVIIKIVVEAGPDFVSVNCTDSSGSWPILTNEFYYGLGIAGQGYSPAGGVWQVSTSAFCPLSGDNVDRGIKVRGFVDGTNGLPKYRFAVIGWY